MAIGGMPVGADVDFPNGYLRHVHGFIEIKDVELIAADRVMADADAALAAAKAQDSMLAV